MTFDPRWTKSNEVIRRDGSTPLSDEWDIGDKQRIVLDELRIQDSDGFTISDTTGIPVVHVEDISGRVSLKYGDGRVNEFSVDGALTGDSDTAVPTEKAVKTYVDNSVLAGTSGTSGISGSSGTSGTSSIVGSWWAWADNISESSTSSISLVQKLRLSISSIPEGYYRVGWYFEWGKSDIKSDFIGQVLIDSSSDIANMNMEAKDANSRNPASGSAIVLLSAGSHTIDIKYASETGSSTSYIRNARIEFWRVV